MAEEEKSIEELEAEGKKFLQEYNSLMKEKLDILKAEKESRDAEKAQKEAEEAEKAKEEAFNSKMETILSEKYGISPQTGTADMEHDAKPNKKVVADGKLQEFLDFREDFIKRKEIDYKQYGYGMQDPNGNYAFTDSDSGCEDNINSWSPADVYCDLIWQEAWCGKQLSGAITVQACDIKAGDGLAVQIRTIDSSDMSSSLGACECSSCSSNVFSTYSLTLARYDVYKVTCGLDVFDVGDVLKSSIVTSMARAFITGIDGLIWTAISGASPTCSQTLAGAADCDASRQSDGNCCTYAPELYKAIVDAEANRRAAGYGANGFYLIIHPTVAAFLKYKEGANAPSWVNNISMEGNKLSRIGEIKVIEYCGANSCTDKSSEVMAILVDPERAVGEAYGKRPTLKTDEDPIECDSTKLVMRTYVAVSALDTGALCHIKNPA